jgi:UDP-N-acetylglucosamine 2-epimerase
MTGKPRVLFPVGYRSDAVLTLPVRRRLRDNDRVDMIKVALVPGSFQDSYTIIDRVIQDHYFDFAIINADRIEMVGAAAACFNNGIPFAHMYAGILNNIGTLDDVNRHVMTLQSTMQFCESEVAAERVFQLRSAVKLPVDQIHTVGITHLDDIELGNACWPDEPYDLIVYNPPATHLNDEQQQLAINKDLDMISRIAGQDDRKVLAILPAPDKGNKYIRLRLEGMARGLDWTTFRDLRRPQFLSVLKYCYRLITNSSIEYYEAPALMTKSQKIIHIGTRNAGRDTGPFKTGASDRIVKIVEDYLCTQKNGNVTGKSP